MSFAFNSDGSKMELDVVFSDININIANKSDAGHTHSASDITSGTFDVSRIPDLSTSKLTEGTLPVDRGGTGQATLQATRNAMGLGDTTGALPIANGGTGATTASGARNALGLGNTTGALPIANGGTGKTTAADARTALGVTKKRNLTANYAGATTNNPDFMVKTFTGSFTSSSSGSKKDVTISVSGYLPIAIAGFKVATSSNLTTGYATFKNDTTATIEAPAGTGFTYSYTLQVLYVRTAMINQ